MTEKDMELLHQFVGVIAPVYLENYDPHVAVDKAFNVAKLMVERSNKVLDDIVIHKKNVKQHYRNVQ